MAERDRTQRVALFGDVPGDADKVRAVLAQWEVDEATIRRLMREHRADPAPPAAPDADDINPRRRADH